MLSINPTHHPLIQTLRTLRGNVRGIVYTEPMWGIPYNLYAPYVSVYMLALGLTDVQIGLLASIGLVGQIFWTLVSGAITDKFGRKRTTFITDIIAWSIPCLIWAVAQDFTYFLVAALINSIWRITHNSWLCLVTEDTDPDILVDVWSLIYMAGLLAAFFAPLTSLLIATFTLVPTMRVLYLFAFVMMTAKFIIMNGLVTETTQGIERMHATRHESLFTIVGQLWGVFRQVLHAPATLVTGGLMVILGIATLIQTTFWSVLVTERLEVAPQYIAIYTAARSATMLIFYFTVIPKLRMSEPYKPMALGFAGLGLSWLLLVGMPPQSYLLLLIATILEGCSVAAANPMLSKLIAVTVAPKERAQINTLLYLAVMVCTSPFGVIAGKMSELNYNLPFVLNILLALIGIVLAFWASRRSGLSQSERSPA